MPNARFNEDGDGAGLPQKVKGPVGGEAKFKDFKNPDGAGDGEAQDINGGGVKMPQDSTKKLPQAGKAV